MNCFNCHQNVKKVSLSLVDDLIENLFINNSDIFFISLLENNLQRYILSFITNMDGHLIIHTRKSRIKPNHMDYDSDDEISGYYWTERNNICTKCFQYGIQNSLECQGRLPFLRSDINYFLHDMDDNHIQNKIKRIKMKYFLPNKYIIDYYRQKLPYEINNNYLIKCK